MGNGLYFYHFSFFSPAWDAVSSPADGHRVLPRHYGVIVTLKHAVLHLQHLHWLLQAFCSQNQTPFKPQTSNTDDQTRLSLSLMMTSYLVPSR